MKVFFAIDQLPRTAWKNGGGTTREIMCWPPGAGMANFDWRVSVASISASGPFSSFEGIDRVIMLLDGDGVWLRGSQTDWRLDQPQQPFAFSGDEQLSSELLGRESTDFNVMTRRSAATAQVEIISSSRKLDKLGAGLVMSLSGSWWVDHQPIKHRHGCWWSERSDALAVESVSEDPGMLVLVSWNRH